MKVVFISNFLNHHQLPFCKEMIKRIGKNNFKFIATEKIPDERIRLGYDDMNEKFSFVIRSYENFDLALDIANNFDVAIIGSAPDIFIKSRVNNNLLTFRYSERLFKEYKLFHFTAPYKLFYKYYFLEKKRVHLLCSSAYAYSDYNSGLAYKNKAYKWGYFPEFIKYDNINKLISTKNINSIIWVARFIDWKHPEIPIEIAKRLKNTGIKFCINMIGNGELLEDCRNLIKENNLTDCVRILGSMSPIDVRHNMEKSSIFLFTSDRGEGWGAVLNEAMNCGCACIVNSEIGAGPYLIKNKNNGLLYEDKNIDDLYKNVVFLLNNPKKCIEYGYKAYETISSKWNASIAASNFIKLIKRINLGLDSNVKTGPCSKATKLRDGWFKEEK